LLLHGKKGNKDLLKSGFVVASGDEKQQHSADIKIYCCFDLEKGNDV